MPRLPCLESSARHKPRRTWERSARLHTLILPGTRPTFARYNAIGNTGGRNGACRIAVVVGYSHSHPLAYVGDRLAALDRCLCRARQFVLYPEHCAPASLRPKPASDRRRAGAGFILRVNVVVPATAYCENFRPLLPVDALPSDALSDRQLEVNCDAMLKGIARIARRDRGLAKLH